MAKIRHYVSDFIVIGTLLIFALLSVSRTVALFVGMFIQIYYFNWFKIIIFLTLLLHVLLETNNNEQI